MAFRSGSADELAEQADYQLLPEDEYLCSVTGMEFVPAEDQKPTIYTPIPQSQYKAHLRVHSFADGAALEDTEGEPVAEFTIVQWINHNRMGMIPQPSRARKFMAACLRQPVAQAIEIENFPDDLIGKQLYVSTINKKTDKGEWTRANDFRPLKIERTRKSADKTEEKAEPVSVSAPAEEGYEDEITF